MPDFLHLYERSMNENNVLYLNPEHQLNPEMFERILCKMQFSLATVEETNNSFLMQPIVRHRSFLFHRWRIYPWARRSDAFSQMWINTSLSDFSMAFLGVHLFPHPANNPGHFGQVKWKLLQLTDPYISASLTVKNILSLRDGRQAGGKQD